MPKLYYVGDLFFEDPGNPITVGDAKFRVEVPFDGEILGARNGPVINGHIGDAGTGAGTSTDVQIRNVTTSRDYLSTVASFQVDQADANGRAILSGGVLKTEPTFHQGDVLAMDIDAVPSGADSAQAQVWVTCGFWRSVD